MTPCTTCGHTRANHIYEDGPCRPGFPCDKACNGFTPKTRAPAMTPLAQTVLAIIEEGWHFGKATGDPALTYYIHDELHCEAITKRLLDALKESEE